MFIIILWSRCVSLEMIKLMRNFLFLTKIPTLRDEKNKLTVRLFL